MTWSMRIQRRCVVLNRPCSQQREAHRVAQRPALRHSRGRQVARLRQWRGLSSLLLLVPHLEPCQLAGCLLPSRVVCSQARLPSLQLPGETLPARPGIEAQALLFCTRLHLNHRHHPASAGYNLLNKHGKEHRMWHQDATSDHHGILSLPRNTKVGKTFLG